MSNIKDAVTIITGASSGIGAATARRLAAEGAKVVLAARSTDKLEALSADIRNNGGTVIWKATDVTNAEDLKSLVETAESEFGTIDNLINNAGLMLLGEWKNIRVEDWQMMIDVNIRGYLNAIAAVLPGMMERQSGRILNMDSIVGINAPANAGVYAGTKFFIRGMTESLRKDLGPNYNIGVSMVSPGTVDTGWDQKVRDTETKGAAEKMSKEFGFEPEAVAEAVNFILNRPPHVNVDDLVIYPTKQDW